MSTGGAAETSPGLPRRAVADLDGVGHRIRAELAAAGVELLNDGVPPDPSRVRQVKIPIGMPVSFLIGELRKLPPDAVFAEALCDADVIAVFYTDNAPAPGRAEG